jgi:uncharacterized protein (TIGR02453 family)
MDFSIILKFLKDVARNNNRDWFEKNKHKYLEAKERFEDFLETIHGEFLKFDDGLSGINPRKMGFRIYRDVRFAKDKRPYKTNMGAGFSPGGKLIQEPGYYIHIEPGNKSFVAAGIYMPDAPRLTAIRQEIDYSAERFEKILKDKKFKKYFKGLDDFDKLKTAPKGYAKDHPQIEHLKHKSFIVSHYFTDAEVASKSFVKKLADIAHAAKPFNNFFAEAIA